MSLEALKQYQVQYTITLQDQASEGLRALVTAAESVVKPLQTAAADIKSISSQMNAVKTQLGQEWTIKPLVNKEQAMQGLKELKALVDATSKEIAASMSQAFSGVQTKIGEIYGHKTNAELVKWYNENKRKLGDGIKNENNKIVRLVNEQQAKILEKEQENILKTFEARGTTYEKEAKKLTATINKAEKAKAKATQTIDALAPYQSLAKDSKRLSSVANSIKKIDENINNFVPKRKRAIKVEADISPAVAKLNTLLKTIRESTAALPVTIIEAGKAAKEAGKSISAATGQATKAGLANAKIAASEKPVVSMDKVLAGQKEPESKKKTKTTTTKTKNTISSSVEQMTALANKMETLAKSKTIDLKATFSDGGVVAQFSETIAKIQELANSKALTLKLKLFNNGDEAFQVNQTITKIQQLANEKPITLKLKLDNLSVAGIENTIVKAQELANSKPITLKTQISNSGNANIGKPLTKAQEQAINKAVSLKVKLNAIASADINNAIAKAQTIADKKPIFIKTTLNSISATSVSKVITAARKIANDKLITVKTKLLGGSVKDITASLANVQKLVDKTPISLKLKFANANALSAGLKSIIAELQHIANANTITVKTSSTVTQTKDNKAASAVSKSKESITQANINAYQRHAEQMRKMRSDLMAQQVKWEKQMNKKRLAARQADLEAAFGNPAFTPYGERPIINRKFGLGDGASQTEHNYRLQKERAYNSVRFRQPISVSEPVVDTQSRTNARGSASSRTAKQPTLFSRAKTRFYGLTGNSSFGATAPMAVDMAKGMGTMFAIGGAMSAIGSSLHQSINYQNIMKTTEAILKNGTDNYSDQGFKEMEKVVRTVGKETKFTAPQVASAAKFLAMAGYDIPSVKSAITPVANLALIGDTDLGETADKMTNVMTTFGIQPSQMNDIADIMTNTFTRSNVDMMMLAESAKYAGGIAKMYGGNFKNNFSDTMAIFGILGNAGIQASSAGTTIRMMYQNLMKPNKNATATMKKYGIVNRDKDGNPLEITAIIKQLFDKVPKNKIADAVGDIFRITAQPGASTLIRALSDGSLEKLINANRAAAGTGISQSIADEKKNTLSGLWAQVESAFTEGILQAVEGREGGWAAMLMKIRDYLSKPETIKMLSSLVDLIEHLLSYMGTFARVWTKIYSMFPGLINGWMQLQLIMTQIGMLIKPIIAMGAALESFGITFGGGAAGATSAGSAAANAAMVAGAAIPKTSRYGAYRKSGMAKDNYLAYLAAAEFWKGSAAKNKYLANAHALTAKRKYGYWANEAIQGGVTEMSKANIARSNRSVLAGEMRMNKYQNDLINAKGVKARYLNNLRQIRRPEQMANEALLRRYMAMDAAARLTSGYRETSRARLVAQRINEIDASRARIAQIAAQRHATRTISPAVYARYNTMFANKRTYGTSFMGGVSAGMQAMSFVGIGASLKGMLMAFVGNVGRVLGALISPLGLAAVGLAAVGTAAYLASKHLQEYRAKSTKAANDNAETAAKARANDVKFASDIAHKYRDAAWGGKAPGTITALSETPQQTKQKNAVKSAKEKYADAFGVTDQSVANRKWVGAIYSNPNALLGFGGKQDSLDMMRHGKKILADNAYYNSLMTFTNPDAIEALENQAAAKVRANQSLRYRGAIAQKTMQARDKIAQLYQQKINKKIDQNEFVKQAQQIINGTVITKGLLDTKNYTAQQIASLTNPANTIAYQDAVRQALMAEINGSMGSFVGQLEAAEQLKSGVKAYTDQWYNAIGHLINGMNVSIQAGKTTVQTAILTLPNGHIDVDGIVAAVRAKVENFNMTITQFASMMSQVYDQLLNNKILKGNYYSDWTRFVYNQIQHSNVANADIEDYWQAVSKGNPNFTWFGMDLDQYKQYVHSSQGAKQRVTIRKYKAKTIGYAAKDQHDKAAKNAAQQVQDQKNQLNSIAGGKLQGTERKPKKTQNGSQHDYENKYGRNAARPTQVIINIDKLANFDRTAIAKDSDERTIANAIEVKIAEAVSMVTSQILTTASSTISQGLA